MMMMKEMKMTIMSVMMRPRMRISRMRSLWIEGLRRGKGVPLQQQRFNRVAQQQHQYHAPRFEGLIARRPHYEHVAVEGDEHDVKDGDGGHYR